MTEGSASERQAAILLGELAKIELQAAVGRQLVVTISMRLGDYALDSPGNLRLLRYLLTERTQTGHTEPDSPELPDDLAEDADDVLPILELWNLLCDADELTRVPEKMGGQWEAGRRRAVEGMNQVFLWLENKIGEYQVSFSGNGKRILEEIIPYEAPRVIQSQEIGKPDLLRDLDKDLE